VYECLKIYVLRCQQGKYYVGKTTNFARRYDEHVRGLGSEWTKKYPPEDIMEVVMNIDKYDEDKYVWKYMEKYGIENVRGGSYSQINLPESLVSCASRHIHGASDLCFGCGGDGHFVKDCKNDSGSTVNRKRKIEDTDITSNDDERPSKIMRKPSDKCFRCGRTGHWVSNCYAKTHINGNKL
jgi:hypothetical protein